MIWSVASVVLSAAAVLLCAAILWKLHRVSRSGEDARTAEQLRRELAALDARTAQRFSLLKQEMDTSVKNQNQPILTGIAAISETNDRRLAQMQATLESRLQFLQEDNARKLESMRATVDEKLTSTLEKRLGESFNTVNQQLEKVYKGLGEMQTLAAGVGDLKKVLTNVKTRGTWGEISLGSLLEQLMSPQQYAANVRVAPRRSEVVEYAIRLPGKKDDQEVVWLPIDSKFPMESYIRLTDAAEAGDPAALDAAARQLEQMVRESARTIRDKYIVPPYTTDFAIMFLPTEGLYAEVTRRAELCTALQRDCRVTIMGPTTLGAFLNSLQMGFRTLAIQKRSGEVWKMLGAVRREFDKFGEALAATQKKLEEATDNIGRAAKRTEIIQGRLRAVEELPEAEARALFGDPFSPEP